MESLAADRKSKESTIANAGNYAPRWQMVEYTQQLLKINEDLASAADNVMTYASRILEILKKDEAANASSIASVTRSSQFAYSNYKVAMADAAGYKASLNDYFKKRP